MRFMIVDDSKLARRKLSNLIEELGYEVVGEAVDGMEALRLSDQLKPDAITMDLEMPVMKGDEAAKKILALNPDIKIILITSIVDKKETARALQIGVKKIMKKPIDQNSLKEAIRDIT